MKNRILLLMVLIASTLVTSCLKANLDEIPTSSNTDVTDITFEYRSLDPDFPDGNVIEITKLTSSVDSDTYSTETGIIDVALTVPATDLDIDLSYLACYITKYAAAVVEPLGDSPTLGVMSAWELNKGYQYRVTAGDGSYLDWTITITDFTYTE